MLIKGYVNKTTVPEEISSNGIKTIKIPTIYSNKKDLVDLLGDDKVKKVTIHISYEEDNV